MRKTVLACALVFLFLPGISATAEDDLSFEITADFFGKYIWRGQNLTQLSHLGGKIGKNKKNILGIES